MSDLPDFNLAIKQTSKVVTLTFKDQTADFILYEGKINGWELDDFLTKCLKSITDTAEVKKSLFAPPTLLT